MLDEDNDFGGIWQGDVEKNAGSILEDLDGVGGGGLQMSVVS